jgi:rhodanese-related sulfurtransferase
MKTFQELITDCLTRVEEIYPWDLQEMIAADTSPLLLDIREPYEFKALHVVNSLNVPRGILESACDYGYDETVPALVQAREKKIVVICRSGNRSVLAAYTMQLMGFKDVMSLKTGIKGWNDFELPLYDIQGRLVDIDDADEILMPKLRPEQLPPKRRNAIQPVVMAV